MKKLIEEETEKALSSPEPPIHEIAHNIVKSDKARVKTIKSKFTIEFEILQPFLQPSLFVLAPILPTISTTLTFKAAGLSLPFYSSILFIRLVLQQSPLQYVM